MERKPQMNTDSEGGILMTNRKKRSVSSGRGRRLRVSVSRLRWDCPLRCLDFRTTDDIRLAEKGSGPGSCKTIGQRRAVDALALGLEIRNTGYNIFVTGPVGTGRTTTVKQMLEQYRDRQQDLDDKCYVNNFKDPDQPRLLRLPAGRGRGFQRDMDLFIDYLVKNVPLQFESDAYQHSRSEIVDLFKERGSVKVREFEKKVATEGFALVQTAPFVKPELAPIIEKQPAKIEAMVALVEEGKVSAKRAEKIKVRYRQLTDELTAIFKEIRDHEREAREALQELDRNVVRPVLDEQLGDIAERSAGKQVRAYLDEVRDSILSHLDLFRQKPSEKQAGEAAADPYLEYRVNVLVDNSHTQGAPVVFETNPNYKNLFGAIERTWDRSGQWRTDFTKIKAGSVLRADRGFLVLNALDVLLEPGVWPALKRTLRNQRLEITSYESYLALIATSALKPEPVAIDLKVVMIGDPYVYAMVAAYDEDFRKVFKVRADFDWVMDLNDESIRQYGRVVRALCEKEGLFPFDRKGVQRVVEYGVRLAGRRDRLSTRFNMVGDVLKEASYWAGKVGAKLVTARHVEKAIEKQRDRVRLYEEKVQEFIDQGTIYIDVTGKVRGQVNGLAVYDTGEHSFGKPTRITARIGVGSAGIVNIEREVQLSGPTHDKGVYILSGYLRNLFAQDQPLVFSASITFEQSYSGIDGDSASSTEVYALLSDLSGLGIRQEIAVTGSVNQRGEIQPIGGVNQKIEGFFETCRVRGLTGTQGVLIPRSNLDDLMLRSEVVDAVRKGKFHVYAAETIDEGIELLTGVKAGKPDRKGEFPPDTVNGLVKKRLRELADIYKDFQSDSEEKEDGKEKKKRPGLKKKGKR